MKDRVTPDLIRRYYSGDCSKEEEARVENWLNENPAHVDQALQWQEEFTFENDQVLAQVLKAEKEVWRKTVLELPNKDFSNKSKQIFLRESSKKETYQILKVAAAISGIMVIALGGWLTWQNQKINVKVAFGQTKQLTLPDNSVVYLNGNSSFTYNRNWWNREREVWLNGEAFFKVTHLKNNKKFLVHLSNQVEVEVLGTEFNISDRNTISDIVLKTGKIKLNLNNNVNKKSIYLRPGDLIEVRKQNHASAIIRQVRVSPEQYYSWTYDKWLLEGTSLREMLQKLHDTYGVNTKVKNKNLLNRRASGSIPLPKGDANLLLSDITALFQLKVNKVNNIIYLEDIR
ncbi:hypothetical protein AHMF7605_06110 [Adhaeribacter arboris]|uniref:FecR protein domain-containing protein n=1 Tax=Adhaeribacter arboris TaxID=2072846 RepID=A0A2T2YC84_9BACT|nr:FecR family protein [Adhaeribacter arboris]PSR53132.1 hypothetical protein AHMF7605_06110 [Adhaeribacter arboris]